MRSDNLRSCGIPYPWDLFYNLALRYIAEREGADRHVKIIFKGVDHGDHKGGRLKQSMATFQLDDVFVDSSCTVPYTVSMQVANVLRGDAVVANPVKLYEPRQVYFSSAFFDRLGAARAAAVRDFMNQKCVEEMEHNFKETIEEARRICKVVSEAVPFYRQFHNVLTCFPPGYFETTAVLKTALRELPQRGALNPDPIEDEAVRNGWQPPFCRAFQSFAEALQTAP